MKIDQIAKELLVIAKEQQLKERCFQSYEESLRLDPAIMKGIEERNARPYFWSHRLTFDHAFVPQPMIETQFRISSNEQEIGYYSLITEIDGSVNDDILVIHDS